MPMTTRHATLPLISCRDPDFPQRFVGSLRDYGFGALIDHPLDMTCLLYTSDAADE